MTILKILKELDLIVDKLKNKILYLETENKQLELKIDELKEYINKI